MLDSLLGNIGDNTPGRADVSPKNVVQETASQFVKFQELVIWVSEMDALQIGKDVGRSQPWCGDSESVGYGIGMGRCHGMIPRYMQVFGTLILAMQPQ